MVRRLGAEALAFSPGIANHDTPFSAGPMACPERDAPSVLEG